MKQYLIVCEKKSQATAVADVLKLKSGSQCFKGPFKDGEATLVWASGHLLRLKLPDEIIPDLKWSDSPSRFCPIPRNYEMVVNDDGSGRIKGMLANISKYIKTADCFILAMDSDNEGEAIGRNIVNYFNFNKEIKRAWLSGGLDKIGISTAFNNLRDKEETLPRFRAAEARQRTDRLFTFLTRAYSYYGEYGKFGSYLSQGTGRSSVISVGRLQTVIVSMIAKRDEEIKNFRSQNHYTPNATFNFKGAEIDTKMINRVTEDIIANKPEGVSWEQQKPSGDNTPLDKPLYTDKAVVAKFIRELENNKNSALISKSTSSIEKESPPSTMELVDAQVKVSSAVGVSGSIAQIILEDLYEQGWLSYARTGHSELPRSLYSKEVRNGMINAVINLPSLRATAELARDIHDGKHGQYNAFMPKSFSDKEMEHYGIVPTSQVMTPAKLANLKPRKMKGNKVVHTSQQMIGAYEVMAEHFLIAMLPPATYSSQKLEVTMPVPDLLGHTDSRFSAKAKKLVDAGWKGAVSGKTNTDKIFPDLVNGDTGVLEQVILKSSRTSPPKPYTTTLLPKELASIGKEVADPKLRALLKDSKGIGQPATRITAIETVVAREYIGIKGKVFYCEQKGFELLKYVPNWLKSPETSAMLEDYMNKIVDCKSDEEAIQKRDSFENMQLERIEKLISHMVSQFQNNLGSIAQKAPKEVTKKMKQLIKSVAKRKNVEIPRGTLSNPIMAIAFLDEHIDKSNQSGPTVPSEGTISYAKAIAKACPSSVIIDDAMYKDSHLLKAFIDSNKKYIPPTEGQVKFVQSIIAKLPEGTKVPSNVETSAEAARKFIDKHKKPSKKVTA